MASKGASSVSGSELAFAISNSEADKEVAEGLELLCGAWGAASLAEMLNAPVGQKIVGSGMLYAPVGTVLGQVASETMAAGDKPHPGWGRLGLMLDFGARPDAELPGCKAAVAEMCAKVEFASGPRPCPEEQAAAMMLARCSMAGDCEWMAKLAEAYPSCASICARELSRRQKGEIDKAAGPARQVREAGQRL